MGTGGRLRNDIPRVWEVDWALPAREGGTRWDSYAWLLQTARDLAAAEVTVLASTFGAFQNLGRAIGSSEAAALARAGHSYRAAGITVRGVTRRGRWSVRGPVLVAWAGDDLLADVEGQNPPAIAAVAEWPKDIALWTVRHSVRRIGQVRTEQEAGFQSEQVLPLANEAMEATDAILALVIGSHPVLSRDERELVAGRLIALREAGIGIDTRALRARLLSEGWNSELTGHTLALAQRIAAGATPRHRPFPLA